MPIRDSFSPDWYASTNKNLTETKKYVKKESALYLGHFRNWWMGVIKAIRTLMG